MNIEIYRNIEVLNSYASRLSAVNTCTEFFEEFEVHDVEIIIGIDGRYRDAELLLSGGGETVILRVSNLKITVSYMDNIRSSTVLNDALSEELHNYYRKQYQLLNPAFQWCYSDDE